MPSTSLEGRNTTVTSRTVTASKPKPDTLHRVVRGGGWDDSDPSVFRSADRGRNAPAVRDYSLGFRCAQRGARQPVGKVGP